MPDTIFYLIIRILIQYTYGQRVYEEMIELRRKLKKRREQEVYRKRELKRQIIEFILVVLLIFLISCFILGVAYLYFSKWERKW